MKRRQSGATLVELIVVIVLTAIVVSFGVSFMAAPVQTLELSNNREQLAADAERAVGVMLQDLRRALPGSLRYRTAGGVLAIEILRVEDSAAALPDAIAAGALQRFDVGVPETSFETLGELPATVVPLNTRQMYLAIRDPLAAGVNVYAGAGVITPAGTRLRALAGSVPGRTRLVLSPAVTFVAPGPLRRVFLLSGPVSFLCDPRSGTLRRYTGYQLAGSQVLRDSDAELRAAGASAAMVAGNIAACQFSAPFVASAMQTLGSVVLRLQRGGESAAAVQNVVITDEG